MFLIYFYTKLFNRCIASLAVAWLSCISNEIVHFLPVFGCLGDSACNCIPTVYSVVMGSSFFSNQDFSANGVVKGVCVCGVAPENKQNLPLKNLGRGVLPPNRKSFDRFTRILCCIFIRQLP